MSFWAFVALIGSALAVVISIVGVVFHRLGRLSKRQLCWLIALSPLVGVVMAVLGALEINADFGHIADNLFPDPKRPLTS